MYDQGIPGYSDPNKDHSKKKWGETRKTKLTLRQLRTLRKMMDVRKYELHQHLKQVKAQYAAPAESPTPGI